jgi:hypothetical protein
MRLRLLLSVCAFMIFSTPAWAQRATRFSDLSLIVEIGDSVRVTDASGRILTGRLEGLTQGSLDVRVNSDVIRIPADNVRTVAARRNDSLANGAWIGLASGAALGIAAGATLAEHDEQAEAMLAAGLVYGGIGAAVGVGIDAMIRGRKVIYQYEAGVTWAPLILPRGGYGAAVTMRW